MPFGISAGVIGPDFSLRKTLNFAKGLKLQPLISIEAVCSHRGMTVASTVDHERVGCEFMSDEADFSGDPLSCLYLSRESFPGNPS